MSSTDCNPKTLGIHWNVTSDTLHVATPPPTVPADDITKCMVASGTVRVYDIIGLFSHSIVPAKILLQKLWKLDFAWDKPIPSHIADQYRDWIQQIPSLTSNPVPRRLSSSDLPVILIILHGFSDASQLSYGAAVYLRRIHADNLTHCTLLSAKSRVILLKALTIPKAEWQAALLLTKLLTYFVSQIQVPI